jgi:hypothetical protein
MRGRISSYKSSLASGAAVLSETAATLLASGSGILLFDSGNVLLAFYPVALSGMRQNSDGVMNNSESHGHVSGLSRNWRHGVSRVEPSEILKNFA